MKPIYLTEEERKAAEKYIKDGTHEDYLVLRANLVLTLDRSGNKEYTSVQKTAGDYGISRQTIYNVIDKFYKSNTIDEFLPQTKKGASRRRGTIDEETEERIFNLVNENPPEGYRKWTLRLLSKQVVELGIMEKVSQTTIQQLLKKKNMRLT